MNTSVFRCCFALAITGLTASCWAQVPSPPQEARTARVEILTRGPLHEAFASAVSFDPKPGMVAPMEPPEAIEELPPEQKPEGNNVAWIPGYFAWDDERNDFIWVSGIWRALPPGRQWVSGYWRPVREGAQWVSGYWADAEKEEIVYLPPPPRTLEEGPTTAAPSTDSVWVPGSWVWHEARYVWRPGYWTTTHPNWDWIPAHYVWAPRGYVYVNGYYDYPAARRGLLFAPVYTNWNSYAQSRYNYSPSIVVNTLALVSQLFLRPSYGHYYFGDYYGSNYASGYLPWFAYHSSHRGYDPFYVREHWNHRHDRDWHRSLQASYDRRMQNENARPPRTWAEQQARASRGISDRDLLVATAINDFARNSNLPIRLQPVAREERQNMQRRAEDIQQFRRERRKIESAVTATAPNTRPDRDNRSAPDSRKVEAQTAKTEQPEKVRLPKSPVVARSTNEATGKDQPPTRTEVLRPDISKEAETSPSKGKTRGEPKSARGDSKTSIEDSPPQLPPAPVNREPGVATSPEPNATNQPDSPTPNRPKGNNVPRGQKSQPDNVPAIPADRGGRPDGAKDRTRPPVIRPSDDQPSENSAEEPRTKGQPSTKSSKDASEAERSRTDSPSESPSRRRETTTKDGTDARRNNAQPGRAERDRPQPDQPDRDAARSNQSKARPMKQDAARNRSEPKTKTASPPPSPTAKSPPPKTPDVKQKPQDKPKDNKEKDGGK